MSKKEHIIRAAALLICEVFAVLTISMVISQRQYNRLPMAIATVFLLLLPMVCEQVFHFKIRLPL